VSGWWRGTGLVCGRELSVGFARRSYRITAIVMLLIGVAAAVLPQLISPTGETRYQIAVVGAPPPAFGASLDAVAGQLDLTVDVRVEPDRTRATAAVSDGDVDAAIVWPAGAEAGTDDRPPVLLVPSRASDELVAVVSSGAVSSSTIARLEAAGISSAQAATVLASPPRSEAVDAPADTPRAAIGFAVVFVLYLFLVTAGSQVATGVAVEKTNRIAESLLSTLRASQLLAGKIIGVGLLALVPLLLAGIPLIVSFAIGDGIDVPAEAITDVVAGFGWFVLGFALYACGYAAMGALVDRQEEVSGAVTPITFLLVGVFFIAVVAQGEPDSPLAVAASLFPLSAPMVMPMRVAAGSASSAEVAVAVIGVVLTAALVMRLGATVYRRALVRTGKRLKLREVLRG